MNRILRTLLGSSDIRTAGVNRIWRGVRKGDRRDLYLGITLALVAWLRQSPTGQRELIFREELPEGSTLVIRHRADADPEIEVIAKPTEA